VSLALGNVPIAYWDVEIKTGRTVFVKQGYL
jgi:hypothetical protein